MHYLFRRAAHGLFLLIVVSVITFLLTNLAPGEFFDEMRLNPQISPETIGALRTAHGLDRPLPLRYVTWLRSAVSGDWGTSLAYNGAAGPILKVRALNTLLLTGAATFLAWLIALPFGIWSAANRGGLPDRVASFTVSGLTAVPEIILGLLLLLCAVRIGGFAAGGMVAANFEDLSFLAKCRDLAAHFCLPVLALTLGLLPLLLSQVRAAMVQVLDAPFILASRAHGIPSYRLLVRHALPAAANPLISLFGLSSGLLLSSSILVEGIFSWPGIGQLLIQSILQRDLDLVVDIIMLSAILLVAGNLLADTLLYAIDPRIRTTQ
jgi:peptide/nickel transport system permease protein